MRLLLDAHTLTWAVDQPSQLGATAAKALPDPANELLLSAGTVWEISIKVGLGKLFLTLPYRQWMNQAIADLGLSILPVTVEYADAQAALMQSAGAGCPVSPFSSVIGSPFGRGIV